MKKALISVTLILVSLNVYSQDLIEAKIRYKCNYKITDISALEPKEKIGFEGIIELDNEANAASYLTLEPPISSGIDVTARILLTRFDGDEYFPMTLHPRGNTAEYLRHADLKGHPKLMISHTEKNLVHNLICHID